MTESVYDAMGGAEAVLALAHHWHERVLADPVVAHAFSHGFRADHTERLAAYWVEQLGGPAAYTEGLGDHSEVLRLHSGNGEHPDRDRRSEACFAQAMDDAGLPDDERLRATLTACDRHSESGASRCGCIARSPERRLTPLMPPRSKPPAPICPAAVHAATGAANVSAMAGPSCARS